eukprot:CAMPEP_0202348200 /NCGR_PEP_ID=MMETSP1126-20121109/6235_1 /ASSEMBLY_ACC=CAM_ASM_000457 /TAXON_ID=3047 /ORGANISM="Dunaliella tertiolecta, Strain CCMP1320" /LENGTH=328 /DNA_ID=CAMNT_0048939859 /DNA_START=175 /DNA_END=1163 /DNA_ORIENTATION=+
MSSQLPGPKLDKGRGGGTQGALQWKKGSVGHQLALSSPDASCVLVMSGELELLGAGSLCGGEAMNEGDPGSFPHTRPAHTHHQIKDAAGCEPGAATGAHGLCRCAAAAAAVAAANSGGQAAAAAVLLPVCCRAAAPAAAAAGCAPGPRAHRCSLIEAAVVPGPPAAAWAGAGWGLSQGGELAELWGQHSRDLTAPLASVAQKQACHLQACSAVGLYLSVPLVAPFLLLLRTFPSSANCKAPPPAAAWAGGVRGQCSFPAKLALCAPPAQWQLFLEEACVVTDAAAAAIVSSVCAAPDIAEAAIVPSVRAAVEEWGSGLPAALRLLTSV